MSGRKAESGLRIFNCAGYIILLAVLLLAGLPVRAGEVRVAVASNFLGTARWQ